MGYSFIVVRSWEDMEGNPGDVGLKELFSILAVMSVKILVVIVYCVLIYNYH
jgi:hypothetical protein